LARGKTSPEQITTVAPAGSLEACGCEISVGRDFHPATLIEHPCADGFVCGNWKAHSGNDGSVDAVGGTCVVPRMANEGDVCTEANDPDIACVAGLTCFHDTASDAHCIHVGELGAACQQWFQCSNQICAAGRCSTGRQGTPCDGPGQCLGQTSIPGGGVCNDAGICECPSGSSCP
jgi:hypothetical protein